MLIRTHFEEDHRALRKEVEGSGGAYSGLVSGTDARSALSVVLLADSFPRCMYRGQPQAFNFNESACVLAYAAMSEGAEEALDPVERCWLYAPLLHSENSTNQRIAYHKAYLNLHSSPPVYRGFLSSYLRYAWRHRDIVQRFGRFPSRNAAQGRPSTPAEVEFLKHRSLDQSQIA